MRTSKFTVEQIAHALKRVESGVGVAEICRELGITETTFYRWKRKFGGITSPQESRVGADLRSCLIRYTRDAVEVCAAHAENAECPLSGSADSSSTARAAWRASTSTGQSGIRSFEGLVERSNPSHPSGARAMPRLKSRRLSSASSAHSGDCQFFTITA